MQDNIAIVTKDLRIKDVGRSNCLITLIVPLAGKLK